MSSVLDKTLQTVTIDLERACLDNDCTALADRFLAQLGVPKYSLGASVMEVPPTVEAWRAAHRTARKRADRAARLAYTFAEIHRPDFNDDIHAINTSLQERQGRPMSEGYTRRHNHGPLPDYACPRHAIRTYGIVHTGTLVAYLTLYRVGDLHLISMILGHGDHLRNDVMYALFAGLVRWHAGDGGFFYYNRHDSGTDGLRYYKERVGFREVDVEWRS